MEFPEVSRRNDRRRLHPRHIMTAAAALVTLLEERAPGRCLAKAIKYHLRLVHLGMLGPLRPADERLEAHASWTKEFGMWTAPALKAGSAMARLLKVRLGR